MSYIEIFNLLQNTFARLNADNSVMSPDSIWEQYSNEINNLLNSPEVRNEFISIGNGIWVPKSLEAARLFEKLRQRFEPTGNRERNLVGRIRADVVLRERPSRNQARASLTGIRRNVAELAPPDFTHFSQFHIEGWDRVLDTIYNQSSLVIVAPTGSGKTEVFLMPTIYAIAQGIRNNQRTSPRFIMLYPRVALLKDQLTRIFRYAYYAEQLYLRENDGAFRFHQANSEIIIGFQFQGIRSKNRDTLDNRDIFDGDIFRIVEQCPICNQGALRVSNQARNSDRVVLLTCTENCGARFNVSISKNAHANTRPHILVTTAESLDRLYLNPKREFEQYLRSITGIIFDEVHLYHSLYGAHIFNLVRRIEELRNGIPLTKIAASATISSPNIFTAKLFHGDENQQVQVHDANDPNYEKDPAGLEVIYFLQSPEESNRPGASPTLIQSVMALSHGILNTNDRAIIFTESLDLAGRFTRNIRDAETSRWFDNGRRRGLWEFRTLVNDINFRNIPCPRTNPATCPNIYLEGECWRGILGGEGCYQHINGLREHALNVIEVSSQQRTNFREGDIVISTPTLEVGVDDENIKATINYLPPRTVFSFIQRRGRAGRRTGDTAYTIMVLGNTPSDHFYFFRRNRIVNGTYELPLNPANPILRAMHDRLVSERERMRRYISQYNPQSGIWRWVWATLNNCPALTRYYPTALQQLDVYPGREAEHNQLVRNLRHWVQNEKTLLENYLSLRWLLRTLEEEAPINIQNDIAEALEAINGFLKNSSPSADEVHQRLLAIYDALAPLRHRDLDRESANRLRDLQTRVEEIWFALNQSEWGVSVRHAEGLYDFFSTLQRLYEAPWILRSAPDTLKILLQALFYLHLTVEELDEPEGCSSRVDYFVPEAYFQVVKPIVIEVRSRTEIRTNLVQENITVLSTSLIPYKTIYRYHGSDLTILDIEHNPEWVSADRRRVIVRLHAEGPHRDGTIIPQKVYVKPLRADQQGQQIVKLCPRCYALHDINRQQCRCGSPIHTAKVYAEPILERNYEAHPPRQISRSFNFLENLIGTTIVFGSEVRAYRANYIGNGYTITPNELVPAFQAQYETPIRYSIPTKGIMWNLNNIIPQLLENINLRRQIEQINVADRPKVLNEEMILHTAAHLLHKAIASISGVNESLLEYWFSTERREVVVWERYEGGAGITEIFEEKLRSNSIEVYKELLTSVLCPVNLSERDDWVEAETLQNDLIEHWRLSSQIDFVNGIVQEAEAERRVRHQQQNEETRLVCRPTQGFDGCPACIHTTYCTARGEQASIVSHLVAEAILECFIRNVTGDELQAYMIEASQEDIAQPIVLTGTPEQGVFNVLLL